MSWETRSTNASQNSVGSDSTFCEELEKNNRSLRKRTSLKYSQSSFNSQTQIKTLPIKSKTNENKKYKKILEDCVFKIRNHLRKIRIMSINEIQSLVNDINKINTSNRESQAMKGKVLRQLRSLFEETTEIEQRFSSLNISNSQAINIFQNSCSKSYQDVTVNDSENTITSNKSNGEELESSFSFDFVNGSEVNINQFPNCTHSSSIVNTIQKDLKKLEEIDMLKNQDPTNKYYEEILQKSSTISLSFDEDMLSNVNFKTPTAKTSLCTQFDSTNIIDDIQSEKSNISNNSPICQAKEEIFNFLPKNMDSEDIIPSSLIENNTKVFQEKFILANKNLLSNCDRIYQNTIPSTFTEALFISQELKTDDTLTNTICNSNDAFDDTKNNYFKTHICNSNQSFPIEMLTNNLFETPSVNLCSLPVCNKFDNKSKFCSNEEPKTHNYSKVTMLSLPFSDESNVDVALKLDYNTGHLKSKRITSPILKKKMNYKTQKYRYTKYSRKYKLKNIRNKVKLNNINILQQVCVVPSQIKLYSQAQQFDDTKEFNTLEGNKNTENLKYNQTAPNLTDYLINENVSAADYDKFEFMINKNSVCNNTGEELKALKNVIERVQKFKHEFANWILQTAVEEYSKKSNHKYVMQNITEEKDITDLNFQLTAQEKIQNDSKINEIANVYRDKLTIEGLPKFEEFSNRPFCVDFDEIDKKYQQ